jgi:hypothetical protein
MVRKQKATGSNWLLAEICLIFQRNQNGSSFRAQVGFNLTSIRFGKQLSNAIYWNQGTIVRNKSRDVEMGKLHHSTIECAKNGSYHG